MAIVETEKEDGIMVIRLNRPDRLNALGTEMRAALAEAWNDFNNSNDRRGSENHGRRSRDSAGAWRFIYHKSRELGNLVKFLGKISSLAPAWRIRPSLRQSVCGRDPIFL